MATMKEFTKIGLGSWMMESEPKSAVTALRAGLDEGANHIDTAEMYGSGRVEQIVGEAIYGRRDKVFITSKVLPSNAGYETTIQACERSLQNLRTDYVDLYLLHWREKRTPLGDTFKAFEKLKTDGKIRAWGVSNFDVPDMEEAVKIVGKPDEQAGRLVCDQVYYSIKERAAGVKLLPWCRKHKVRLVAYSPLGQGRLPEHRALTDIAADLKVTPAQVALAYLIHDENVIAIPKSSNAERTRENVRAMKIRLTDQQMERLSEAFPVNPRRSLPMV
jgi:diketogulonate reductase-like aldo/keto reductase